MADFSFFIIFSLAIIVFLLFGLHGDKNPRDRFTGDRSWSRQANFNFRNGIVLVLAMAVVYLLFRLIKWALIHSAL